MAVGEKEANSDAALSPPDHSVLTQVASSGSQFIVSHHGGQCDKMVSLNHKFYRQRQTEAELNLCLSAYHLSTLPLGHTGSTSGWEMGSKCRRRSELIKDAIVWSTK